MLYFYKMEHIYLYRIVNIETNKVYIGSTINRKLRLKNHISFLEKGKHKNKSLQKDFNKYGKEKFIFEYFLEKVPFTKEIDRGDIENFFIKLYDSFEKGYNNTVAPPSHNINNSVYRYSLEGEFIDSFKNANKASRELNIDASSIIKAIKNKRGSVSGYLFFNSLVKDKNVFEEYKKTAYRKPILKKDSEGNILKEYSSFTKAFNEEKVTKAKMTKNLKNTKDENGFIWEYKYK